MPYTSVTERVDGSYAVVWDQTTAPQLATIAPDSDFTLTFPTRTRANYQQNFVDDDPILARDSWTNTVAIAGPGSAADRVPSTIPDGTTAGDESSASQSAGSIVVDKTISAPSAGPVNCSTATYIQGPANTYHPGDRICYRLRVTFPSALDTGLPDVTDFLPAGVEYEPGSMVYTAANTIPPNEIEFDAGDPAALMWSRSAQQAGVDAGAVFEAQISAIVSPPVERVRGDILDNLLKVAFFNSGGQIFAERDEADAVYDEAQLDLVKGVRDVNGGPVNPPDTDGVTIQGGDRVTFRLDVTNSGGRDALDTEVWDPLPTGVTCAMIDAISDGGTCGAGRLAWTGVTVPGLGTTTLTYRVTAPPAPPAGLRVDNHAGVRTYATATNTGGTYAYIPADNIDAGLGPANAPAADDTSYVVVRDILLTKARTTGRAEAGNAAGDQATIGELIDYTLTTTVPDGTTLYGPATLSDPLGPSQTLLPATLSATLNGAPLPIGSAVDTSNNTITASLPSPYSNPVGSGDDVLVVTFSARVNDVAANVRGATVPNTATLNWSDGGAPHSTSASVSTTVVEPALGITKDEDDADDRVAPGQTVRYTVTATNAAGASVAHDVVITDTVPPGMEPVLPISDGGAWDPATRTLTWTLATLDPGASAPRVYDVVVASPAAASTVFPNTATVTATSLPGAIPGERTTYSASAQDTVRLQEATLTKAISPDSATVGDRLTATVDLTLQPNVVYFDTTIVDTLPDGLDYDATTSITCVSGCPPNVTGTTLPAAGQADGSTLLGWFLGDLSAAPAARVVRVIYTAHVDDTYQPEGTPVSGGQALTNSARGVYDTTDRIVGTPATVPAPGGFDGGTNTGSDTVAVIEPHFTIDKDVSGDPDDDDARETQPGDTYTYTLTVRNDGTAPAYDVTVSDQPDAELTNVVLTDGAGFSTDGWTAADPDLRWVIAGPIAPGASVTLRYTAALVASSQLTDGETVVNTADVPSYFGVPALQRAADGFDYRDYDDVTADTVTLTVDLPSLAVVKTTGAAGFPDSANAEIGQRFPWRVTVTNTATTATAFAVRLEDLLPADWTYVAGSATPSEPTVAGRALTWANLGDLGPGQSVVVTFDATPSEAAATVNVNGATATARDAAGAGGYTATDTAQAQLLRPDLTIVKTPDGAPATAGAPATWTVRVGNTGTGPARNVRIVDVLPAGVTYTPGTATAAPAAGFSEVSVAGQTVTWNVARLDANASVDITVPVRLAADLASGTTLVNTATATADEDSSPVTDPGSFVVSNDADVAIVKTAGAPNVTAGTDLDYTLTVINNGPSDAANVVVSDPLPAGTTFVSTAAPCGYNAPTTTVICALGTLTPGQQRVLTLRVHVDPGATGTVVNTATVTTTTPDTNEGNNSSTATVPILTAADLSVTKTADPRIILQGATVDYEMTVRNAGPSDALNAVLIDTLPPDSDVVSADPGCVTAGLEVTCALGTVGAGQTVTRNLTLRHNRPGFNTNHARVTTTTPETRLDNNDAIVTVIVGPAADLSIVKAGSATVEAGGVIRYGLVARNAGPSAATNVKVTDTLPPGTEFVSGSAGCTAAGLVVTCELGDIPIEGVRAIELEVRAPAALGGQTLTNVATVDGLQPDPDTSNNTDDAETVVGPAIDLAIVKTTSGVIAGQNIDWTLVVSNLGPSTATNVVVEDTLPPGVTFVSATPAQGTCDATVRCELGTLAVGASTQIILTANVPASLAGTPLTNTAKVSGTEPETSLANNQDAVTVTPSSVVPAPSTATLQITKTPSTTQPKLGVPFDFVIPVTNLGPATATNVVLTEPLPARFTLVSATPTQGSCSGKQVVTCRLGTLAPGARATVTVRVIATRAGQIRNTASADSLEGDPVVAAAVVRVTAPKTTLRLTKRVRHHVVKAGKRAVFNITLRANTRALQDATLCDRLPTGLSVISAPGARFVNGRPCWSWAYLPPHAVRKVTVIARVAPGVTAPKLINRAGAAADNAGRRTASDYVRVVPLPARDGGVTG